MDNVNFPGELYSMVIPRYLYIFPCVVVIIEIFPYSASVSERTLEKVLGSTFYRFRLSTFEIIVHILSLMILFMTHQTYLFL